MDGIVAAAAKAAFVVFLLGIHAPCGHAMPRTQNSGQAHLAPTASLAIHAKVSISGDLNFWTADNSNATSEERIAAIVNNLASLQKRLDTLERNRRSDVAQTAGAIVEATEGLTEVLNKQSVALWKLGAGSIQFEFVGILWLVAGIILASIPIELAPYVQWAK